MLYHSNCKYTLNLCRATYRRAVKESCTALLVTLDHMIQLVQTVDSCWLKRERRRRRRKGRLLVLQVNIPQFVQEPHAICTTSFLAFYIQTTALILDQVFFHSPSQKHNELICYSSFTDLYINKNILRHLHRHCVVFQDSSRAPRNSPAIASLGFTHKYHSVLNRGG